MPATMALHVKQPRACEEQSCARLFSPFLQTLQLTPNCLAVSGERRTLLDDTGPRKSAGEDMLIERLAKTGTLIRSR